jgi:hypothetical protein
MADMKLQATIVLSFQAPTLTQAGEKLDDVLERARARDDVDIESVELHTPAGAGPVSLPQMPRPAAPPMPVPHPGSGGEARNGR